MNNVILAGRLTKNPEIKYIGESKHLKVEFSIAVDRDYKGKDGTRGVDFIPIEIWGREAELCSQSLYKGKLVEIEGSILIEKYKDKNGDNRLFTKVKAKKFKLLDSKRDVLTNKYFDGSTIFDSPKGSIEELLPF